MEKRELCPEFITLQKFSRFCTLDTLYRQGASAYERLFWTYLPKESVDRILGHFKRRIERQEGMAKEIVEYLQRGEPHGYLQRLADSHGFDKSVVSHRRNSIVDGLADYTVRELGEEFLEHRNEEGRRLISTYLQMDHVIRKPRNFEL